MLRASGTIAGQILTYSNPTMLVWPTSQPHGLVTCHLSFTLSVPSPSVFSWVTVLSLTGPHLGPPH